MSQSITITLDEWARALDHARRRERQRCAVEVQGWADSLLSAGGEAAAFAVQAIAESLRSEPAVSMRALVAPAIPIEPPKNPVQELLRDAVPERLDAPIVLEGETQPGDALPPHREYDDFAEGSALVQGGMWRHGLTGRLRRD